MKTWKIVNQKELKIVEDTSLLHDNTAKVKINKTFISSTDLLIFNGLKTVNYPITPCRMASGAISEVCGQTSLKKGERVVLTPYISSALNNQVEVMGCDKNGFLCDYAIVPLENVSVLPDGISDVSALFIEYIAIAIRAYDALKIKMQDYVVILGGGITNNILAQLAIYHQAIPILVDGDEKKLSLARDCDIYYTINSTVDDVEKRVLQITAGQMADQCVYGYSATQDPGKILSLTKTGGKIGVIGYNTSEIDMQIDMQPILEKQLSIVGINNGYKGTLTALNLLQNKAINVDNFIETYVNIADISDVFNSIKVNKLFKKIIVNC